MAKKSKTATSDEARENQMIDLAITAAEKQLREGTASSQIICHYLKLGSSREKVEQEKLRKEMEVQDAKIKNMESVEHIEELYTQAIEALKTYGSAVD